MMVSTKMFFVFLTLSAIDATRGLNLRGKGRELQDICHDFPSSVGWTFSNRENMQICEWADRGDPSADDTTNIANMISKCGENVQGLDLEIVLGEDEVVGIVADWCAQTCAKVGVDPNRCQGPVTVDPEESQNSSGCLGEDTMQEQHQEQEQQQQQEETNAEPSEEEEQTIDDSSNEIDCQDNSDWTRDTIQGDYMNCIWVGKRSEERTKNRCKRDDAMENCPGTCNAQCQGSVNYVGE